MKWNCENCKQETDHHLEYIADAKQRPETYLSAKLTCNVCKTVDWSVDEIFDSHACAGSGVWCYCNDTRHQHCVECDAICETDPTYEP